MALKCYTCGEEIIFDKSVLSKSGKQIPLWTDKQNTHGHDDHGNPVRGPLPTAQLQQQQQQQPPPQYQYTTPPPPPPNKQQQQQSSSQGGESLDTKRMKVLVEEISKKVVEMEELLNAIHQLSKNNMAALSTIMEHFKLNDPVSAAALHQKKQATTATTGEVHGWNSIPNNNNENDEEDKELEKEGI